MLFHFDVDDDSPEITYFPSVNLEPSPNLTSAGWDLLYTHSGPATYPGEVGIGTSYHYTCLDGAAILINWNGTAIDLIGAVSNARYNISLDGVPFAPSPNPANATLASFNDLDNTHHSLLLTTIITNATSPDAYLTFDKARIMSALPANTTVTSQTIDDSDIAFMGSWNYVADPAGISMHVSNSSGDRAETTFQGSAITLYGLTSSYSGNFSVTLDNVTTDLSALSSYNNSNSLLFYATNLPPNTVHHIAVTNQQNRTLALRVGGMNFTYSTVNSTTASRHLIAAGTIAAIVLGAILFLIILSILYYFCCMRRRSRAISRRILLHNGKRFDEKSDTDIEQVTATPPTSGEIESTNLSTSKGYGIGLGLRLVLPFTSSRKNKSKRSTGSSENSRSGAAGPAESHPMTLRLDRDEHIFGIHSLTEKMVVPSHPLESEKLAPGWCNPVALPPSSFNYARSYNDPHGIVLPGLHIDEYYDDDADVKTLTCRQDEALAATLTLSPRTSEGFSASDAIVTLPKVDLDDLDHLGWSLEEQPELLQVRDTSPFRVDMATIFGTRRNIRDSRRTSGSAGSTWSKVRSRLYRRAHRDDGRQSCQTDRQETSSSSGPESVPVVMHESSSAKPPGETAPGSGSYSFLDFTSSHTSLRRHSKTTTLSSTPADIGHGARETSAWSENTSIRMIRVERSRDDMLAPKPDAPSTAYGSHPSDDSGTQTTQTVTTATTMHTRGSSPFSFSIAIPSSTQTIAPPDRVPDPQITPSPPDTPFPDTDNYLQVPQIPAPELSVTSASSPTESVPFSVSDIHFRHSFSDYAGFDSRRASASSVLPPHPPLPHVDGSSQASTPPFTPPPPYIVQRVLGLPMSPLSALSPSATLANMRMPPNGSTLTATPRSNGRPDTAPSLTSPRIRVGSLLGPRPRPSTAGSVRGTAPPQLPMQGGRSSFRNGQR